jgi:hypothetical protein
MFDNKLLISLIGIAVAVQLISKSKAKAPDVVEGFGDLPSFQVKVERSIGCKNGNDFYSIPSNFQPMLSPRMFSGSYGANITYNIPDRKNLAVPCNPLGDRNSVSGYCCDKPMPLNPIQLGNVVSEGFKPAPVVRENYGCGGRGGNDCAGGSGLTCGRGGQGMSYTHKSNESVSSGYAAGNFDAVAAELSGNSCGNAPYPEVTNMIPVGTMNTCNGLGEDMPEVVVYDRYIYANRNSRLRSQGDPIRGDLPIVPCSAEWFRPSVAPNIDLQQGALQVIAGVDMNTSQQLAQLMNYSSGGVESTFGGVDMSQQYGTCFSSGYGDITVTSYP